MNFAQEPVDFLVQKFPTADDWQRAILFIRGVPLSGYMRRQLLSKWANRVNFYPSQDEYERVSRDLPTANEGGL
jgi:hypothetical protein